MGNVEKLKEEGCYSVLSDVREFISENYGIQDEQEIDNFINLSTPSSILDYYLTWNGIIGYSDAIYSLTRALKEE